MEPSSLAIWEVAFTFTRAPVEVESWPAPDGIDNGDDFLFLPALSRPAFSPEDTILI